MINGRLLAVSANAFPPQTFAALSLHSTSPGSIPAVALVHFVRLGYRQLLPRILWQFPSFPFHFGRSEFFVLAFHSSQTVVDLCFDMIQSPSVEFSPGNFSHFARFSRDLKHGHIRTSRF